MLINKSELARSNSEITKWPTASGWYSVQRTKNEGMLLCISKECKAKNYFLNLNWKAEMLWHEHRYATFSISSVHI